MTQCPYCNLTPTKRNFEEHKKQCYIKQYIEPASKRFKSHRLLSSSAASSSSTSLQILTPEPVQAQSSAQPFFSTSSTSLSPHVPVIQSTQAINNNNSISLILEQGAERSCYFDVDIDEYDDGDDENPTQYINTNENYLDSNDSEIGAETYVHSLLRRTTDDAKYIDMKNIGGSKLSSSELLSLKLMQIINRFHLSDACYEALVAWANDVITVVSGDHDGKVFFNIPRLMIIKC
ncbi:hypothetical protein BDC45DRAFT_535384 [Circinella umbellata]|nr:hypothetical protein BDC45DRAFT_535384 [Circinella umbellata]